MKYSTEVGSGYWGPSAPLRSAQDVIRDWGLDICVSDIGDWLFLFRE